MKIFHFISVAFKESLTTIIVGIAGFILVLVLTLNLAAAAIALVLVVSIAIFQKSLSRGWLFLLGIILLFPSMKIGSPLFNLNDFLLAVLAAIGMASIVSGEIRLKFNNLSFYFFLLGLIGFSYIFFGILFNFSISPDIVIASIVFALYWVLMTTFQFFFQTRKRLRRFFVLVIAIAVAHSVFGIVSFIFGFQTPGGLGISSGAIPYLENMNIKYQANGFLGDGHVLRIGQSALAPLLLISIPLTMAFLTNLKNEKRPKRVTREYPLASVPLFDSIHVSSQESNFRKLASKKGIQKISSWLKTANHSSFMIFLLLFVQIAALVLTFDYFSMLLLAFAVFAFGILLRKKQIITTSIAGIILLTIVFPSIGNGFVLHSENSLLIWFEGFSQIKNHWIWGSGWKMVQSGGILKAQEEIYNSYLFVWNTFGIFGAGAFVGILIRFFMDLREKYLESEGSARVWLISILVIFFEMTILGVSGNVLLFGPAAVVFWLLYSASLNLGRRRAVFGLTETRLQF